jgi:hypothetical protein
MSDIRRGSFTQHLLSADQLRAGLLAVIDHVEIPDEPLAMTKLRSGDLNQLAGISFQESFDDLDFCSVAVLHFGRGFWVTLKDMRGAPVRGVVICTQPRAVRPDRLNDILRGLNLTREELIWVVPEAADPAYPA